MMSLKLKLITFNVTETNIMPLKLKLT